MIAPPQRTSHNATPAAVASRIRRLRARGLPRSVIVRLTQLSGQTVDQYIGDEEGDDGWRADAVVARGWRLRGVPLGLIAEWLCRGVADVRLMLEPGPADWTPTPTEIAERAAEVRKTWSAAERAKRCSYSRIRFRLPTAPDPPAAV